jgi:5-oxoprolinase (ATP-hydrolysing)
MVSNHEFHVVVLRRFMSYQLYIDTGGTFTDALALDPDGGWQRLKVLSSSALRMVCTDVAGESIRVSRPPARHVQCLIGYEVVRVADGRRLGRILAIDADGLSLRVAGASDREFACGDVLEIRSREQTPIFAARLITGTPLDAPLPPMRMRLATTKGTNALLERKGVAPVLVMDQGLGDLPLIGTQQRPDLFALRIERLPVLHHRVVEVGETVDLASEIAEIKESAFLPDGSRPVAIALRNSYQDRSKERTIGDALRDGGLRHVSCSSDLAPLIRLLPRVQTAVIDAYLSPVLDAYLREVAEAMPEGSLMVMHSAGGLESRNCYHAKDSLLSGPAAGVKGVEAIGALSGRRRLIGFDMGGTSTDVCRIDGRPDLAFEHRIGDATLFAPMLAIQTVAAGGGSICGIRHGELFVGPESAGAHPGPACYGAGGPLTLTDVNLLLGRLSEEGFGIPINRRYSEQALAKIATEWGQDPETLLDAWIQLADERMAEAIRRISVRKGYDPADYALVSFGGAGGQHACAVARLLGIRTVLFPSDAGLLSAWGLQHAHREQVVERQILASLDKGLAEVEALLQELSREGQWEIDQVLLGIRFTGMDSVEWIVHRSDRNPTPRFLEQFERVYGFVPDRPLELESVRVQLRQSGDRIDTPDSSPPSAAAASPKRQRVRIQGRWQELDVMPRAAIQPDAIVREALLALDPYSTTFIEPGWETRCDAHGTLIARYAGTDSTCRDSASSDLARLSLDASRLQAIALEMGEQLQRTALSVNVKERLDFSCAVLDPDGFLVVNAPHIPVHLGALGICVRAVMQRIPLEPGDVIVTNHPAFGGSHLPDVTVITPVLGRGGQALGFVANRAHHAEIGGAQPGSMPPSARRLVQEGVVIPPMHLFRRGQARWAEVERVFAESPYPSRNLAENRADLLAAVAANRLGQLRLQELADRIGSDRLLRSMGDLRAHAARRMREQIGTWPWRERAAEESLDDGSRLCVRLVRNNTTLTVDFTGTSPVHPGNLNATPAIVHSVIMYVMRTLVAEDLPLNEGLMEPIEVILPPCMLNPGFDTDPAHCPAVVGGNVETSQRLVDTLLKPFGRVACSQGTMNNLLFGNDRFGYYETICGGTGAGAGFHGADAVHHHMTNTRITDPEVLEWRYPVRLETFAIRRGSGGRGRFRGGNGVVRKLRFREAVQVSVLSQHRREGPYGLAGGGAGAPGRQWVERSDGRQEILAGIDQAHLEPGDALVIETPGGGAWGTEHETK